MVKSKGPVRFVVGLALFENIDATELRVLASLHTPETDSNQT